MPPAGIFRRLKSRPCLSHFRQGLFFYGLGIPNRPWPPSHPHLGELFIHSFVALFTLSSFSSPGPAGTTAGPNSRPGPEGGGRLTRSGSELVGLWSAGKEGEAGLECVHRRGGWDVRDVGAAWRTARGPVLPGVPPSQTGGTGQRGRECGLVLLGRAGLGKAGVCTQAWHVHTPCTPDKRTLGRLLHTRPKYCFLPQASPGQRALLCSLSILGAPGAPGPGHPCTRCLG